MKKSVSYRPTLFLFVFLSGLSRGMTGRILTGSSCALTAAVMIFLMVLLSHLSKYDCMNAGSITAC